MSADKVKLSTKEKVDYVPAFLSIGGTAIAAPVTGLVRGSDGADTYTHHITHALIRKFNSRLNSLQAQNFQPSFGGSYQKWCQKNKQEPDFVNDVELGVKGFWMGDKKDAKYVVVYYHGGGFANPGSEGHLRFWGIVRDYLALHGCDVAFFFVTYTLTPHKRYPAQLDESIAAVEYLVTKTDRKASDLILAGDSAGGNLAVAVLLHMTHPCPKVERKFRIAQNFKALILMAPWVSFATDWPSFKANKNKDYIEADVEGRWSAEYLDVMPKPRAGIREVTTGNPDSHPDDGDMHAEPGNADSTVWQNSRCDKMLIVYGDREALSDPIEDWVKKYEEGSGKQRADDGDLQVFVGKNEVHIAPIVWPMFGDKKETETGAKIKEWMLKNLGGAPNGLSANKQALAGQQAGQQTEQKKEQAAEQEVEDDMEAQIPQPTEQTTS